MCMVTVDLLKETRRTASQLAAGVGNECRQARHLFARRRQSSNHANITRTIANMRSLLSLALLLCQAQALYFYIDGPTPKCFFEELPKDTLVVGERGHYASAVTAQDH